MPKVMVPDLCENLRKMNMFATLNDREISEVTDKIVVKIYHKDEVILWEDETNSYMYLVLSGRVKVVSTNKDGKENIRAIHEAGDSFGELSMLDSKTSPAEVKAMEDTTAAKISKSNFFEILHTQGKVLDNLLQMLCGRLRDSWERVDLGEKKSSTQRITILFQHLALTYGMPIVEGTLLNIRLTHQTLASMTGMTRETITRGLDLLQKDNCIRMGRADRKIVLLPEFLKLGLSS